MVLPASGLGRLVGALDEAGYRVIGPTMRDGAIVLSEIASADELPFGWGVKLAPGGYQIQRRDDQAAFAHSAGPQSWKQFLHLPRERLWSARKTGAGFEIDAGNATDAATATATDAATGAAGPEADRPMAFIGVRPCDLRAIGIQDVVLGRVSHPGSAYAARREGVFIVAVNCTEPGETCFCTSMGAGPAASPGYDLLLTELTGPADPADPADPAGEGHRFLVEAGSPAGADLLAALPATPASPGTQAQARAAVADAADQMGRSMPSGVRELLARSYGSPQWEDVATRCLSCGNCTMACPTCFCTTVTDTSDLDGENAGRWQLWDSCFDLNFSYLSGGAVRSSPSSRYRQWLTHKLSTWHDQFGSSGCVGCGRCIVWCPVGIDLTAEVAALSLEDSQLEDSQLKDRHLQDGQA